MALPDSETQTVLSIKSNDVGKTINSGEFEVALWQKNANDGLSLVQH